MLTEQSVLETLRRVPDRIILAVMGRDLVLNQNNACLCGWFVREKLAEIQNRGASEVYIPLYPSTEDGHAAHGCERHFGGGAGEWEEIYHGVCNSYYVAVIETAFAQRVDEAVSR